MQRLQQKFEQEVQPIRNEIAMKQADVEMQLNLQTKQFDINSQQAQQALSQFNTLVGLGALDNANGDDIAAIVRTTGLSSSMIQGAINARNKKDIETKIIEYDDGTNQGFAVVNSQTGEIISKQVVVGSKPKAATKATEREEKASIINAAKEDAVKGMTVSQIFDVYSGFLDADLIYQIYNANSKYGPDTGGSKKILKKLGITN